VIHKTEGLLREFSATVKGMRRWVFLVLRAAGPTIYYCYRSWIEQRDKGAANRERGAEFRELLLYFLLLKIERRRELMLCAKRNELERERERGSSFCRETKKKMCN
jgi:hypothetical protein